jgi:SAM-dependent methyltransferase
MNPMVDPARTDILSQGISTIRETVARDPGMDRQMRRRTRQVREVLGLGRGGALLDIGCGLGRHLFQLKDHFARAEGVELCATSVQFCRERGLTVYDVPLEEARLPESSYDVVMMSQVLEHLPDPRGTCREIRRLLRPDGYLYLDTPNFASLSMRLFRSRNAVVLGSSHVSLFDVGSLRNLLASLGFEVVSAKTYQTDLFPVDVACYLWGRSAFRHRRNLRFPLYLLWYRAFHVVFEEHVFTNLGARWGAYLRAVARRSRD